MQAHKPYVLNTFSVLNWPKEQAMYKTRVKHRTPLKLRPWENIQRIFIASSDKIVKQQLDVSSYFYT
jgi:hypothetical protein